MEMLELPVLRSADTLDAALEAMRDCGCASVLVEHGVDHAIAFRSSIDKAKRRGVLTLDGIRDTFPAPLVSGESAARHALDLAKPRDTRDNWTDYLRTRQLPYAIARRFGDRATVVTRHEGLANMLTDTFYCDAPAHHTFPYPKVTAGEECPECVGQPKGTIRSCP